jgi:hypothetical protein
MLAVAYDNWELARNLVDDGADPWLRSGATKTKTGDNGSVLLFAIQRYRRHYLSGNEHETRACMDFIDHVTDSALRPVPGIDEATEVSNLSCMSEAIRSTDPVLVKRVIEFGADVEALVGGDEFSPVYLTLNELKIRIHRRACGVEDFIRDSYATSSIQSQRMTASASLGLLSTSEMHNFGTASLMFPGILKILCASHLKEYPHSTGDENRLIEILRVLLDVGADPERLQTNGFTALGYCQEIANIDTAGAKAAEVLREYGAREVIRWSEKQ